MAERMQWVLFEWRSAHLVLPAAVGLVLLAAFYATGAFHTENYPYYFGNRQEFIGMTLLFVLMPPYTLFALITGMRQSLTLARTLDNTSGTRLEPEVRSFPPGLMLGFAALGALYAITLNIPDYGLTFFEVDTVAKATILGQLMVWTIMGLFLPIRFRVAWAFNMAGNKVPIDIFETGGLRPFARNGLVDVLIVSGAIVLSAVQSLDLSFRLDNYSKAMVIALPSIVVLALLPMWQLHKRMAVERQQQLDALNEKIRAASKEIDTVHIEALEILLQRRERVLAAPTWPVDIKIIQRFLFYIVIPPLAWVGAALVEMVIDGFIS